MRPLYRRQVPMLNSSLQSSSSKSSAMIQLVSADQNLLRGKRPSYQRLMSRLTSMESIGLLRASHQAIPPTIRLTLTIISSRHLIQPLTVLDTLCQPRSQTITKIPSDSLTRTTTEEVTEAATEGAVTTGEEETIDEAGTSQWISSKSHRKPQRHPKRSRLWRRERPCRLVL
jgi:hypothetical protein